MKQKATITITSNEEDGTTSINMGFSPSLNLKDESKNPPCHWTAIKMMDLYKNYRGEIGEVESE